MAWVLPASNRHGRNPMKSLASKARSQAILFGVAALLTPLTAVRGQEWRNDIQYASTTSKAADDAVGSPVGDNAAMADCTPQQCCPREYDACDELQARIQASAKRMADQGIIYAPGATQFYQGVARGGNEQDF